MNRERKQNKGKNRGVWIAVSIFAVVSALFLFTIYCRTGLPKQIDPGEKGSLSYQDERFSSGSSLRQRDVYQAKPLLKEINTSSYFESFERDSRVSSNSSEVLLFENGAAYYFSSLEGHGGVSADIGLGKFKVSPLLFLDVGGTVDQGDPRRIPEGQRKLSDIGLPGMGVPVTYLPLGFTYTYLAPDLERIDDVKGNAHFVKWSAKW